MFEIRSLVIRVVELKSARLCERMCLKLNNRLVKLLNINCHSVQKSGNKTKNTFFNTQTHKSNPCFEASLEAGCSFSAQSARVSGRR